MNFIDLFAGAGGLSEGFQKAGFNPIAHVESDLSACFTLKTRAAYYYLHSQNTLSDYHRYLKGEIKRKAFYKDIPDEYLNKVINATIGKDNRTIFKKIDELRTDENIDLIVGGPPCQAYSVTGRSALKHVKKDKRKLLYKHYGSFLKRYSPKLFVFENVPGLKTSDGGIHYTRIKEFFEELGYKTEDKELNSFDFGVVQNRKRLIIIGWKKELDFEYPEFEKVVHSYTREDIFSDLTFLKPGHNERTSSYTTSKPNEYLKKFEIRNGIDFVTQHITRPHNDNDLYIYGLAIAKLNEGKRLKNNEIPKEKRTQKNVEDFLDRFKVVDTIPHTMIAHISKDGHHFIHPDSEQLRSISIREAARIQSFPDDYHFEGVKENQYRSAAFRQIGNAVPPLMAYQIAQNISKQLNDKEA